MPTHTHTHTHTQHRKGTNNYQDTDEKKPFLDSSVLTIYPGVAGKLRRLSKLPTRTDNREWMATNCKHDYTLGILGIGILEYCTRLSLDISIPLVYYSVY